jgi:hypothetical protein
MSCPTSIAGQPCSGHGNCLNMAEMSEGSYDGQTITYGSSIITRSTIAWDYNIMRGCVCHSSWSVGFEAGQYQQGEYFSPDCSQSKLIILLSL